MLYNRKIQKKNKDSIKYIKYIKKYPITKKIKNKFSKNTQIYYKINHKLLKI